VPEALLACVFESAKAVVDMARVSVAQALPSDGAAVAMRKPKIRRTYGYSARDYRTGRHRAATFPQEKDEAR